MVVYKDFKLRRDMDSFKMLFYCKLTDPLLIFPPGTDLHFFRPLKGKCVSFSSSPVNFFLSDRNIDPTTQQKKSNLYFHMMFNLFYFL